MNIAALDFDFESDINIFSLAGTFNNAFIRIDTVGNFADGRAHTGFGAIDNFICQIIERIQTFILEHFNNFLGAHMIGSNLRSDIPIDFFGRSHIPADHVQHRLIQNTGIVKL